MTGSAYQAPVGVAYGIKRQHKVFVLERVDELAAPFRIEDAGGATPRFINQVLACFARDDNDHRSESYVVAPVGVGLGRQVKQRGDGDLCHGRELGSLLATLAVARILRARRGPRNELVGELLAGRCADTHPVS